MLIRNATSNDANYIRRLYLEAFDPAESAIVSDLAVNLLNESPAASSISLVTVLDDEIIAHVAFSPVYLEGSHEYIGYILAPLAVVPDRQQHGIGSALVRYGLDLISHRGSAVVFVYGDPTYYSRFGFTADLAARFTPPYPLQYPAGWQSLTLNPVDLPEAGKITCVASLDVPELW